MCCWSRSALRRWARALLLAAVPTTALLGPAAVPAAMALHEPEHRPPPSEARIQDPVVLYASHTRSTPLEVRVEAFLASQYEGLGIYDPVWSLAPVVGGDSSDRAGGPLTFESGRFDEAIYVASTTFTKFATTGQYLLTVTAEDENNFGTPERFFHVKRNTMMPAFNASPEPVRKGSPIKVAGRLTKLWPDVGYVGYRGKTIDVYFKPVGGSWTLKGSATTDSNGCWSRSFTASEDGSWQARFKGTSNYHRETSRSDYVDVQ